MIANDRAEFCVKLDFFPGIFEQKFKLSKFLFQLYRYDYLWWHHGPRRSQEETSWRQNHGFLFLKTSGVFTNFLTKISRKKELWIKLHEIKTEFRTNKRTGHTLPPLASMANPRYENVTWVVRMPGIPCHQLPLTVLQT